MRPAPAIEFTLNGRSISAVANPLQTTLLDYLRNSGLTGAKEGCAEGECGACTVLSVVPNGTGSEYRTVNSCLMFLPMAAGQEFYTVESLADNGDLCEAQQAMAAAGGSQCGYCTPGFVMSLFAEQYRPDRTGPCDPGRLSGNLCRCTGYRPIRDAAVSLGAPPAGDFLERLSHPAPRPSSITFTASTGCFSRPATIEQCVSLLGDDPSAKIIAGGTDLCVESNLHDRTWGHIISLDAIDELRVFQEDGRHVRIGAGLPLSDLERLWPDAPAAVHEFLELFASTTIRNRATLGGNLANASPIGDGAPLLLALDAQVELASPGARRTVALSSFFTAYRQTVLEPAELITAIEIPKPFPQRLSFFKISKRRLDDISTVAACMALSLDRDGRVSHARYAFGGVAATPLRSIAAEDAAIGQPWTRATVERVQRVLDRTLQPMSDHRGSAAYRSAVSQSLVEKFWFQTQQVSHG